MISSSYSKASKVMRKKFSRDNNPNPAMIHDLSLAGKVSIETKAFSNSTINRRMGLKAPSKAKINPAGFLWA